MKNRLPDPAVHLLDLYEEWKSLTEKEGTAIVASNWAEVRHCQKAKQQLQPKIILATGLAKSSSGSGSGFDARIRECVNELIQLESRNNEILGKRLESAEKERAGLDRTSQRLRQVQKSYVPPRGAAWDQYS